MKDCQVVGCTMAGVWNPVILLWAPNSQGKPCASRLGLYVCELHRRQTKLEDLLTDDLWDTFVKHMKTYGLVEPDRRLTTLDFAPAVDDLKNAPEVQGK